MKKNFELKIIHERIVDTRNYRYVYVCLANKAYIKRLPLDCLDTTAAIDGWEIVKKYR